MVVPRVYRRRSPLIHAVQVTDLDIHQTAELVGGRVGYGSNGPQIWLPKSRIPAGLGDYAVQEHTDWFAMRATIFEYAYEPACGQCGRG